MSRSNFKRWVAGLCAATMLAGVPAMVGYATNNTLTDSNPGGQTEVTAEVTAPATVSYIIAIPDKIDFGQIQQPSTGATSPVSKTFTVSCVTADGLASGQGIAVMVKDETAATQDDPFVLVNDNIGSNQLFYQLFNSQGMDITSATWYTNGFLFATFSGAGQESNGTLTLDRAQLYNRDTTWQGRYTGKLNFYTSVASVSAQSMDGGMLVVD